MNRTVSVIIPMYNSKKTIIRTIESIVSQTYKNIEIVIVDDCSDDDSYLTVDNYINSSSFCIELLKNEVNSGPSFSRNRGIDVSSGYYITFVDSDDIIAPQYIEHLVKAVEEDGYDFAFSEMTEYLDADAINFANYDYKCERFNYSHFSDIIRKHGYSCGSLFKADIIKENKIHFSEECRYMEDNIFNLDYLRFVKTIGYVSSSVYCYIRVSESITHPKDKIVLIKKTKIAEIIFEKNSNIIVNVSDRSECAEFISSRRYFRNCYFGEIHSSKYTFKVADQRKSFKNNVYCKIIRNSDLSIINKCEELIMLIPFFEKLIYKILL